ncbi:hypothetical protein N7510_005521 [Penicillium lagena]|uniref:uncharacterized protein n=1 Tax=Penicillium lagena TaxID=94218 RepID=UPI002541E96E|nr:uncharacterized protein N7510_005521 [Penicillium lagena]KAJ5612327.1 hypothetical protein N7510_005521 [Penicillium lagena]
MPKRKAHPRPEDQDNNTYLRVRSIRACGECRRRKRKCDGRMPCSSCAGHGYRCEYDTDSTVSKDSSGEFSPAQCDRPTKQGVDFGDSMGPSTGELNSRQFGEHDESDSWSKVVIRSQRSRVISSHSAVALPRILGHELNDPTPPRLHSYGWNLGLRAECRNRFHSKITSLLSEEECYTLSTVFFSAVHPTFSFLQQEAYFEQVQSKWTSMQNEPGLEAVICGVAALGSFFSTPSHPLESELVGQCLSILDMAHAEPVIRLSMELLAGWILRTIYMRLTTRPYIACLASQTAMHVAETLSLHRDLTSRSMTTASDQLEVTREEAETRRRYFWIIWSLNYILSTEYGLTPVKLQSVTCRLPSRDPGASGDKFVGLALSLQSGFEDLRNLIPKGEIECYLGNSIAIEEEPALLAVFRADICLCLLRRMLCVTRAINKSSSSAIVTIIQNAFEKIHELTTLQQPWWNLVSVPFQTICVCLWFDSLPILSLLPEAMDLLRLVAHTFDTHLTREALATAQHLTNVSREREAEKGRLRDAAVGDYMYALPAADEDFPFPIPGFDPLDDWLRLPL